MIFVPREVYILVVLEFLCFFAHFVWLILMAWSSLFLLEGIGDCLVHRDLLSVVAKLQVSPLTFLLTDSIRPLLVPDHHTI